MARQNVPFLSVGNRGLVSPKALARVDLDRTRLSAERFENFIGKTQGALTIRPGTKYKGSSLNDTGAEWLEFVASTDDVALLEITNGTMRVWLGDDAHELELLSRPLVSTTLSIEDTGWSNTGTASTPTGTDLIPTMAAATTDGVTITASSENTSANLQGWRVGDDNLTTYWLDTGDVFGVSSLPSWVKVDFGVGKTKTVGSYTVRSGPAANTVENAPRSWFFQGNDVDTGSFASWTTLDTGGDQTGWAVSEKRTFTVGSPAAYRFYRLYVTEISGTGGDGSVDLDIAELELFDATGGNGFNLNAGATGKLARRQKRVVVDTGDLGVEHGLELRVARGPVTLRVGSTSGDDDYVREASLGTGYHNIAFTPTSDFHVTLQSASQGNRIVSSIGISDSGAVEITAPWSANDIDNIRYDQSADVVYVDSAGVAPYKIERRGTGRPWSVVKYEPDNGPFLPNPSSSARMQPSRRSPGNGTLNSDIPFFTPGHVGSLVRIFHDGQSGFWFLGALDAYTDAIEVTGLGDTGTPGANSERRIVFSVAGTWSGTITIERSINDANFGFKPVPASFDTGGFSDTGTFTKTIDDPDDNLRVWYRARVSSYSSGTAQVTAIYGGGGVTGIARITGYNSNIDVDMEVLSRFSDTGPSDNWQEGYWSDARSYPTAVALHGGRLGHAQGGSIFLSVSDDYENFDEETEGDAGPIIRTLGSGPVDSIHYLTSLQRLIIGTAGTELTMKSSSLDEPLTPTNSAAVPFSTQGSANLRAVKMDNRAIFVQRSRQRVFMIGAGVQGSTFGDYEGLELTLLVPDLLAAKVRSIAVQRQPDTRIHCALEDGTVAILTYEPSEEVICWTKWSTDGFVEKVACLPGVSEDAVYYHIRRTINGATKRYLEKWAMESECLGDTGLCWLADCAVSFSDTGRAKTFDGVATHLAGESVIAWGDLDTGTNPYVDLSPDVNGVQTTYAVDTGGDISFPALTEGVHQGVVGLPYTADWRSSKLAYAAEAGTALAQVKRSPQMGLVIYKTHQNGLFLGSNDTGTLDPLPRMYQGAPVDPDHIYEAEDVIAIPLPSKWATDPRIHVRAKAPRPATVLALVPSVATNERV